MTKFKDYCPYCQKEVENTLDENNPPTYNIGLGKYMPDWICPECQGDIGKYVVEETDNWNAEEVTDE
ncbi:MAG: hypothetical protein M3P08_07705 [Thermoproteota archaeon]|nr:hypothetical protein [Thermoproteota archaeon]